METASEKDERPNESKKKDSGRGTEAQWGHQLSKKPRKPSRIERDAKGGASPERGLFEVSL